MQLKVIGLVCMVCVMTLVACNDDEGSVKPVPQQDSGVQDMGMDMMEPEPDLPPDLPEEVDMAPDLPEEVDMAPDMAMDPMISGMWQLKSYENDAPTGEAIATFDLMNAMGVTAVEGSFTQGQESGTVAGTFSNDTLSLEWTVDAQNYQFVNGTLQGSGVVGNYNDPNLGGIPQAAILVRP